MFLPLHSPGPKMVSKRFWLLFWLVIGPSTLAEASCPKLILDILSGGDPGEYSEIRKFQTDYAPDLSPVGGMVFQQTTTGQNHEVSFLGSLQDESAILMAGTAEMVNFGHPHQTAFSGDGNRAFFFATQRDEKELVVFDFSAPTSRTLISDFGSSKELPECLPTYTGLNHAGNRAVVLTNCGELRIFNTGGPAAYSRQVQAPLVFAKKFGGKLYGIRTVGDRFFFFTDTSLVVGKAASSGADPELLESVELPEIEGKGKLWEIVGVSPKGNTAVISLSHWGENYNFIWNQGRKLEKIPVPYRIWEASFSTKYVLLAQYVPARDGVVKVAVWDRVTNQIEDRIQFSYGQDGDDRTSAFLETTNIAGVDDAWMVALGATEFRRNCPITVYCFTATGKVQRVGSFDGPRYLGKVRFTKDGLGLVVTHRNYDAPENKDLRWTTVYRLSRNP